MGDAGTEDVRIHSAELAPGIWILRLGGPVDGSSAARVEAAIDDLFAKSIYRIVVDLKEVKFVSSAGFSSLLNALYTATGNNGDLVFVGTPPPTLQLFKTLGLFNSLRFAPDEQAALTMFPS